MLIEKLKIKIIQMKNRNTSWTVADRSTTDEDLKSSPAITNAMLAEASSRPILFSSEMVRAILDGRKTQTRRIVKMKFDCVMDFTKTYPYWQKLKCPYGKKGDVLWVRETFLESGFAGNYFYKADDVLPLNDYEKWKPSIFMPKQACRIFLEITNIRVERLQDISEEDAKAEGTELLPNYRHKYYLSNYFDCINAQMSYMTLWKKINGEKSWDENPYVWVITFERTECPEGFC